MVEITSDLLARLEGLSAKKPGAARREMSEIEREAMLRYWGTGRTIEAMARAFGVSQHVLRRWAEELKLR